MPKGKAPFPSQSSLGAGLADKSRPVRGGYKRAESTDPAVSRTIARSLDMGKKKVGFSSKSPGPDDTIVTAPLKQRKPEPTVTAPLRQPKPKEDVTATAPLKPIDERSKYAK